MIAKALVQNGARVYISSRKADVCDAVAAQLNAMEGPGECISLPADLASDAACVELAAQLAAKEDKLHILFNNAGATWLPRSLLPRAPAAHPPPSTIIARSWQVDLAHA